MHTVNRCSHDRRDNRCRDREQVLRQETVWQSNGQLGCPTREFEWRGRHDHKWRRNSQLRLGPIVFGMPGGPQEVMALWQLSTTRERSACARVVLTCHVGV